MTTRFIFLEAIVWIEISAFSTSVDNHLFLDFFVFSFTASFKIKIKIKFTEIIFRTTFRFS